VLAERRKVLTEMESKALLAAFHIPVTRTMLARSANEAMLIASQLGYPVALKIDSPDISHKSDVQGVVLGVQSAAQVRDAYNEMLAAVRRAQPAARINGVTIQPMAGLRARARGLCRPDHRRPLRPGDHLRRRRHHDRAGGRPRDGAAAAEPVPGPAADRALRVYETLGEWRGAPAADIEALERVLLRVSEMVCALPQLREMDINPIIVDDTGAVAVDARIVIDHAPQAPGAYATWPSCPTRRARARMADEGRRPLHHPPHPPRRRRHAAGLGARPVARKPLLPLRQRHARAAGAHAGALHADRLRPRDGAGGGAPERLADDGGGVTETERIIGVSRYITNPDQTSCEFRWWCPTTSRARAWARG
jgi:acetyltransferase